MKALYHKIKWYVKTKLLNKKYWNLIWQSIKSEPFDYFYLYDIEKAKLEDMLAYFQKTQLLQKEDKEKIIFTLKYCIYCINLFTDAIIIDKSKYINTKNVKRFFPHINNEKILNNYINNFPDEIYKQKAFHLYHELKKMYSKIWWD